MGASVKLLAKITVSLGFVPAFTRYSSGGFGAVYLALRHPDVFSSFASHAGDMYFEYCYKRDAVTIYGNVVKATHGETRNETLGSGDGSQALQSFMLKQPPLMSAGPKINASSRGEAVAMASTFASPRDDSISSTTRSCFFMARVRRWLQTYGRAEITSARALLDERG